MNVLHELARIGRTLSVILESKAQDCQCATQQEQASAQTGSMCGCGQDTCQIGDGSNACRPQTHAMTEQI